MKLLINQNMLKNALIFIFIFSQFLACQSLNRSNLKKIKTEKRDTATLKSESFQEMFHRAYQDGVQNAKKNKALVDKIQSGEIVINKAVVYEVEGEEPICMMDFTKDQKKKIGEIGWTAGQGFKSQVQFKESLPICSQDISHEINMASRDFKLDTQLALAPFVPFVLTAGALIAPVCLFTATIIRRTTDNSVLHEQYKEAERRSEHFKQVMIGASDVVITCLIQFPRIVGKGSLLAVNYIFFGKK